MIDSYERNMDTDFAIPRSVVKRDIGMRRSRKKEVLEEALPFQKKHNKKNSTPTDSETLLI